MKRTLIAGAVIALAALAGCSSAASTTSATSSATGPAAASACVLGATSAAVEIDYSGSLPCEAWVKSLAGTGLVWQPVDAVNPNLSVVCALDGAGGTLTVYDDGGQMYGQDICSGEEQNGWVPDTSAEQEAGQSQANAQASYAAASASASAQAVTASEVASVPQADAQVNADARQMEADITTYNADVQTAKADLAKAQGEPACQGGTGDQQTYDDATTAYADGSTVYADENAVSNDEESSLSDVAALQTDLHAAGLKTDSALQQYGAEVSAAGNIAAPAQHTESTAIENAALTVEGNTNAC